MEIGIIGLPGSGKTTLLNALTQAHAETGTFGGGAAQPNLGVVKIPDPRLDTITAVVKPQRVVRAELSFVDIPGQPPELGRSKGIQGQYLLEVSQVEALLLVIRAFRNPDLPDPTPEERTSSALGSVPLEEAFSPSSGLKRLGDRVGRTR